MFVNSELFINNVKYKKWNINKNYKLIILIENLSLLFINVVIKFVLRN